jgi:energy-coupling factor transport system ATP-binding protein
MIEFKNLTFQYPGSSQPVFDNVKLRIPANSLTLVSGPSGSGKSTLLRCINGLVPHFSGGSISGTISAYGMDPIAEGPEKMAEQVGFVFQEPEAQFVYDTVEDEIAFVLENFNTPYQDMHQRVEEIIETFELECFRKKKIQNLSGGEKQKVALASVMVNRPRILLLDEPTSQLDPTTAKEILEFVLTLKSRYDLTVLISEHRLERLLPYIDRIVNIDATHNLHFGDPQEILPAMSQVPPIIKLARRFNLSPLPLRSESFTTKVQIEPPSDVRKNKASHQKNPTLIKLSDFSVAFSDRQILENISLNIHAGEILTIHGPNGAGKTTLLRAIMGLVKSKGSKQLLDKDMTAMALPNLVNSIAYLPQNPNDLLFSETVLDELKTTLNNHGIEKSDVELTNYLAEFGLAHLSHQFPRDLSVGERQRTALAAITIHEPKIIFLDEPTRGMDYDTKASLTSRLQTWRDQNKAIVLVTHDIEFAASLSDRAVILEAGQFLFKGAPRTAFTRFPKYQTQTARIFPGSGWITPNDVPKGSFSR